MKDMGREKKMKRFLNNWINKDAEWYHFWRPQSDFVGGVIMGVVLLIVAGVLVLLLAN